jgi:spermidine synthase
MNNIRLGLIVFLCGAIVMIYELVGTRVLAPYLGTSTYVWTSLIGVILGSLSIGYCAGGRVADRKAEQEVFAGIIFLAAVIIGITTHMRDLVLSIIELKITDLRWGSLLASIILFAPASIFLGMVSPYAVKLKTRALEEIGSTVGDLYAFSTVGSIIGTFLAGFYLIPRFGTNSILVMISLTLTAVAIIALPSRLFIIKAIMLFYCFVIIAGGSFLAKRFNGPLPLADVDTEYSRVQIYNDVFKEKFYGKGKDVRIMRLGNVINSGIYLNNDELFLPYTRYFRLVRHFRPDSRYALMIGGGAFVYPRDYLRQFPLATMDVVEIDPRLKELARQYFGFHDDTRLRVINQDGRTFLNQSHNRYDVIFCDAFSSYLIPYQLTTQESVKHLHRVLNDNGVVLVNIISSIEGDEGRFLRAEYATFRAVFPQVFLFATHSVDNGKIFQNIMLVAIKGDKTPAMTSEDPELNSYLKHLWLKEVPRDLPVLTDDYAPVEHYIGIRS